MNTFGMELVPQNLGVSFEYIILIIFVSGSLIFFAKDFKLGLLLLFIGSGSIFIWFYQQQWNYTPFLIMIFLSLILLAFSLLSIGKHTQTGGYV